MENIIYLELAQRGYSVDVGVVQINEGSSKKQLEIDFLSNQGSKRTYIQTALYIENREKREQEERPFLKVQDSFRKIIIVKGRRIPAYSDKGILTVGLLNFLLGELDI